VDGKNMQSPSPLEYPADSQSLGKLKEWRRAKDGDNESRPFGFAIFEDAESTNRGFRLLEELEIPSIQPEANTSKLTVSSQFSSPFNT
jgi:hypothetical protein